MIRLDKYLSDMGVGTRSQVKLAVKKGMVRINGETTTQYDKKIEETDQIEYQGRIIKYEKYVYYMLHKPAGVVSATHDAQHKTVMDLCPVLKEKGIFPVGRLDKDTEGLLLLTNDGDLAHSLLSPRKKVPKTYYARITNQLTVEGLTQLRQGVAIGEHNRDGTQKLTLPAEVEVLEPLEILITIVEGKYHQIKRMVQAAGSNVEYLKRLSMGSLSLDESLKPGEYRPLTKSEVDSL